MSPLRRACAVALASCLLSAPAAAQLVSFTFSGGLTASWTLPQAPTPDFANAEFFAIDAVGIVLDGTPRTVGIEFYTLGLGGGLCLGVADLCDLGDLFGDEVLTGPTSSPAFMLGTFSLFDMNTDSDVRLVIDRVPVVPEPSALLLLSAGVAGLFIVRRRHRANAS